MKKVLQILWLTPVFLLGLACSTENKETAGDESNSKPDRNMGGIGMPRGVLKTSEGLVPGYALFTVQNCASSYLVDRKGEVVHEWKGNFPGIIDYLTDSGTIVRVTIDPDFPRFHGGGNSGRVQEISWEGDMLWDFEFATEDHLNHHDIAPMPNGNVLVIAWEAKTKEEILAAGRKPEFSPEAGLWPNMIVEIKPIRPRGGEIVWEWHSWDHMIQGENPDLSNYGDPSQHPELLDINAMGETVESIHPDSLVLRKRKGRGHRNQTIDSDASDVHHMNAINYNAALDQIALSSYMLGEVIIIDHSTTTQEAAGHIGGRYGKGGDLLYRWGNPANYQRGDSTDRVLYHQHDIRWIEDGKPGAGHLTVFDNDIPDGPDSLNYSAVLELIPPMDEAGNYIIEEGKPFGPEKPVWTYTASDTVSFYSGFISGAHRLENGNTFITAGAAGRSFEVTPDKEIIWEYWTPYRGKATNPNGDPRAGGNTAYQTFRVTFVPENHLGLKGKDLTPIDPQPEPYVTELPKRVAE